jgi:GT2 family glycosyltransferase
MVGDVLVSAIVVTLDAGELLNAAIASVERALRRVDGATEILVVSNAAPAAAMDAVRERFAPVRVLELGVNAGFAGGVNAGLDATSGEWVLLLNDDATIEPDGVRALLHAARDRPDVGSLAAQMRFARDGRINSAGLGLDRLGVAFDLHVGSPVESLGGEVRDVFGASAGAALVRRAMLDDVGPFDASFFMYLDDVDLAWRAQMRGWRCLLVPGAVVHHHHSASSIHGSAFKHFHVGRNRVRLLAKHMPAGHLARYGAAIVFYDLAYVAFAVLSDRTLAPLRGRVAGLHEWRTYRARGRGRRPVALAPVEGVRRALARHRRAWAGTASGREQQQ